jgi:tetratricopeptide (TPR) repeat protein
MKSPSLSDTQPDTQRPRRRGEHALGAEPLDGKRRTVSAPRRPSIRIGAGALVLLAAGAAGWRWLPRARRPEPAAVIPAADARLLTTAAHEPGNPAPYRELAERYSNAGRPASALWACTEAAERAPRNDVIRLQSASALSSLGQLSLSEQAFREIVAGNSPERNPARRELAELLLKTGRPGEALTVLEPLGPDVTILRGRASEAMGDAASATTAYRSAATAGDAEGDERLARLDLSLGRVTAAQEAMRALAKLRAPQPADLLLVAAVHEAAGTPRELGAALDRLHRCIDLQPRSAAAHEQAGLLLLRKGDRAAALQQFRAAAQIDPARAETRGRLAETLQAMGQTARADRERASYYELKGQPDLALALLRRTADTSLPDDAERTAMRVRLATDLQQVGDAVKEARAGLERHPGDPQLMLPLGLLYQPGEWRVPLERLCRDWMARQPASGLPYWLLGRQAVGDMRADDAIRLLTTACEKEPNRADFCAALGIAYLGVAYAATPRPEYLASARLWLEKALALNPRLAGARINYGKLLEQTGDLQAAQLQYLQCLDAEPGEMAALNAMAQVSTRLRQTAAAHLFAGIARAEADRTRARHRLERAIRMRPADSTARVQLARFLIRTGDLTAAHNQLERAAETGPDNSPARALLAEVKRWERVQSG